MKILGLVVVLFAFIFLLIKSADIIVHCLRVFSKEVHAKIFLLSAILIALATSFPELFVGITSAVGKNSHLSLGNVMGANIANISLVAGLAAILAGSISIHEKFIRHEVWIALAAGVLPIFLTIDGVISKNEGIFLLAVYIIYALSFFKDRFLKIPHLDRPEGYIHRFLRNFSHPEIKGDVFRNILKLLFGLILLLISAEVIVKIALLIANDASIPIFLVGLFLLSIGTTLPELAFSIRSIKDHQPTMFYGNLLGSIIANSTLIVGVAAIINPIKVVNFQSSLIAGIAFIVIFSTFWFLIKRDFKIGRKEAAVLLFLYAIFVVLEFL